MPRRRAPLRDRRPAAVVAPIAAALTAIAGAVNVASALTPELHGRVHALDALAPAQEILLAHRLALPLGMALLLAAPYLALRRRGALWVAVALLVVLGGLNLLKGLDVEEALLSWLTAAALVRWRGAFWVRHDDGHAAAALRRIVVAVGGAIGVAVIMLAAGVPWQLTPLGGPSGTLHDALRLLTLEHAPVAYRDPVDWVPGAVQTLGSATLALVLWLAFRRPRSPEAAADCNRVSPIVRAHGADTLSFFKLRGDVHHLFSTRRDAVLCYRVEGSTLLIAGDPVGPPAAIPALLADACRLAEVSGLRVGVLGASESFAAIAAHAGLRSQYLGDEAIVETATFSLEGRRIKKVRQAVGRVQRHGYTAELRRHGALTAAELDELEGVAERWRAGVPDRGFSMALDTLRGEHLAETLFVVARDADGAARGFAHYVPVYGRPAVSLSLMPRERDTPNGLTEFLVVESVALLRERDIEEVSLNFAAFARLIHTPASPVERVLGRLAVVGDRFFQIESLYRFNRKFQPRWEPRYLLYEGRLGLPRTGIAALRAEGQMPLLLNRNNARPH